MGGGGVDLTITLVNAHLWILVESPRYLGGGVNLTIFRPLKNENKQKVLNTKIKPGSIGGKIRY